MQGMLVNGNYGCVFEHLAKSGNSILSLPRGKGKTTGLIVSVLWRAWRNPDMEALAVFHNQSMAIYFLSRVVDACPEGYVVSEARNRITFHNGSSILANNPTNLRGRKADYLIVDDLETWNRANQERIKDALCLVDADVAITSTLYNHGRIGLAEDIFSHAALRPNSFSFRAMSSDSLDYLLAGANTVCPWEHPESYDVA